MKLLTTSVDTSPALRGRAVDVSDAWNPSFPSSELVGAAAALFERHTLPDRGSVSASVRASLEHGFRDPRDPVEQRVTRELIEGPRWRVEIAPGAVAVRQSDPVRAFRTWERAQRARAGISAPEVPEGPHQRIRNASGEWILVPPAGLETAGRFTDWERELIFRDRGATGGRGVVRTWSRKSRARMVEKLAQLDWAPLFEAGDVPAMVTLTYPGDWETVASGPELCSRHVQLLRKRFRRAWGVEMIGAWKREFQDRGAPHYHILMVPPHGTRDGMIFRDWLSITWAQIVGHPDPVEFRNHVAAGTGVDYPEGLRMRDPKRVGVYFSKHGIFSDKEYQNSAPELWADSVGRFWGYWGLRPAVAAVEVSPVEGQAVARTLRRYSRANSYVARVPVWRYKTLINPETGEVTARWRRSTKLQRVYRVRGSSGFLTVNDGPSLGAQVARHVEQLRRPTRVIGRSGSGPAGFLP